MGVTSVTRCVNLVSSQWVGSSHKYIPADIDTILKVIVVSRRSLGGWYLAVVALLNHAVQLHFISVPLRRERGGGGKKRGGGLKVDRELHRKV